MTGRSVHLKQVPSQDFSLQDTVTSPVFIVHEEKTQGGWINWLFIITLDINWKKRTHIIKEHVYKSLIIHLFLLS